LQDTKINIVKSPNELNFIIQNLDGIASLRILNQSIWESRHHGVGRYYDLAKKAIEIALENQDSIDIEELAQAYLNLGNSAWNRSENELAAEYLQKAQKLFRSISEIGKSGFAEAVLSNLHSQKGEYEYAFAMIYKVIDEMQSISDYEVLG